jgi:hypothetical protein
MLNSRKLALRKETLTDLSSADLVGVAGAASFGAFCIVIPKTVTCVTCIPLYTVATCTCPTGASCPCPTAGC